MKKEQNTDSSDTFEHAERALADIAKTAESTLGPYRKSVFKRFPTLFTLLVTFGVAAVFFGFERIIAGIPWLIERPLLILLTGVVILVLTGTLYKKLG